MSNTEPRLLILGAHPDDAEYHAGGLATAYRQLGREVKLVSVTNGAAGHYERSPQELIPLRRAEAAAAGRVIGATYETWDFPDGALEASLDVRHRIIAEIRQFNPSLVLTHRMCDYHPDHRSLGQCVVDASYLVTVPHVVPETPAIRHSPVIAYLPDVFRRPTPLRPDVILDLAGFMRTIAKMLACQRSQVFEWLAYEEGILESVPDDETQKLDWVESWFANHIRPRAEQFRDVLNLKLGQSAGKSLEFIEAFEISEYAQQPSPELLSKLFPGGIKIS